MDERMNAGSKRFVIALSFPGERRAFVARVADALAARVGPQRVLYDHFYEAEFARPDLDTYLQRLYHDESELIAVFLCAEYEAKDWCGLEWRALRDLIKRRQSASIMPLRFDTTEIPGLFSTDGYVWIDDRRDPAEIAGLIYQRWQLNCAQAAPPTGGRGFSRTDAAQTEARPAEASTSGLACGRDDDQGRPDNPFDPWTPAVPPAFVGRRDILRALELAAREGRGVSLVGEWRMGKTSILKTWQASGLEQGLRVCLVSGQGPEGAGQRALVARVVCADRPDPEGAAAAALDAVPETADGAADRLAAWCDEGRAAGPGPGAARPILLLDEAEALLTRCEPRFLERLRGLLSDRRLSLVLATRRTLDAIYRELGRTSPFGNVFEVQRVGLLDGPAARALIERGAARWQPDDPDWLLNWAGAHPFYLGLLARRLFEARGAGEPRERALDGFREEAEVQLNLWWPALAGRDQESLRRAARGERVDAFRLRQRGLLTEDNRPFSRVLSAWLNETS